MYDIYARIIYYNSAIHLVVVVLNNFVSKLRCIIASFQDFRSPPPERPWNKAIIIRAAMNDNYDIYCTPL